MRFCEAPGANGKRIKGLMQRIKVASGSPRAPVPDLTLGDQPLVPDLVTNRSLKLPSLGRYFTITVHWQVGSAMNLIQLLVSRLLLVSSSS
jgi:hypothetical protein